MDRVKTKIVQSYSGQICEMVVSALPAFCCFQSSTGNTIYIHCRNILGLNSLTYNVRTLYVHRTHRLGSHLVPKRNIWITFGLVSDGCTFYKLDNSTLVTVNKLFFEKIG